MESAEKLNSLLRKLVARGPWQAASPACLGVRAILRLLNRPEKASPEELRHLAECGYCQRAVALARRERKIVEAPWSDEALATDFTEPGHAEEAPARLRGVSSPIIKLGRQLVRWPAITGIAAAVVLAVGLSWWLTSAGPGTVAPARPELLGEIGGDWAPVRATRGDEKPKREYVVHVELDAPAYLTWLYLDWTRQLQLPKGARQEVVQAPAEPQQFEVTLGLDEPPGPQWIAAVASEQPFDAFELRGELQAVVDDLPKEAPFDDAVARLKEALREHEALTFRSHRFMVPADEAP